MEAETRSNGFPPPFFLAEIATFTGLDKELPCLGRILFSTLE
jgi:hypothetical protein